MAKVFVEDMLSWIMSASFAKEATKKGPSDALGETELLAVARHGALSHAEGMQHGPDVARIAALIGDPARANILNALMGGQALTARELAEAAGVTPATASGHLAQLSEAGLLWPRKQGRHRYFALADAEVAHVLESLAGLAASRGHLRTRPGPKDADMREARVCYDHLAGTRAVAMFDAMADRHHLHVAREEIGLTEAGQAFIADLGIDTATLQSKPRPLCRVCLDWSERRSHLSGALGAALLSRFEALGWVRRTKGERLVRFTPKGLRGFEEAFGRARV